MNKNKEWWVSTTSYFIYKRSKIYYRIKNRNVLEEGHEK